MTQGNEMRHLREAVDHSEDHILPAQTWEALNEVHGDVAPHMFRNRKWLKKTSGMQVFGFITLTNSAAFDIVSNQPMHVSVLEGCTQPMECLLRAFMTGSVSLTQ